MPCTQKQLENAKRWRVKNLEKSRRACQKWRENNREAARNSTKRWEKNNPGKMEAAHTAYRKKNPAKTSEWAKKWRAKNPDYSYKRYGLSAEGFQILLVNQNGKCAICQEKMKKTCVDHCHETNKVRGLLCHSCNVSLGLMKDSFTNLIRAADYIRRNACV